MPIVRKKNLIQKFNKSHWIERLYPEASRKGDGRLPYEHDADRIVYTSPFRRLQAKTQVLGIGEGDFHRTRLTHSIEVAQLGMGIVRFVRRKHQSDARIKSILPSLPLITAICLSHDLGHPPFGHGGERALNSEMIDHGGFEGNAQTLRILAKLERKTQNEGLNLTRRTLLGVLKYPVSYSRGLKLMHRPFAGTKLFGGISSPTPLVAPPKCYYDSEQETIDWILRPFSKNDRKQFTRATTPEKGKPTKPEGRSFDSSLMELADDIAYGVHDLEDVVALHLITSNDFAALKSAYDESWATNAGLPRQLDNIVEDLFSGVRSKRRECLSEIINALIISIDIKENPIFDHPLLKHTLATSEPAQLFLKALKDLVKERVVCSAEVKMCDFRGQYLVTNIFRAILSDPRSLLKENFRIEYDTARSDIERMRVLSDFVSGMSDEYASRLYERLFVPHEGSIFQKL